jgi:putative ABC transport system permease protein
LAASYPFGPRPTEGEYAGAIIKVKTHLDVVPVRKLIEEEGFETTTVLDFLEWLGWVFVVFDFLLAFFGSIGIVVAFFGIANTMVMAVLERVREIGILKALGARSWDIRLIFLIESAGIGFGGGLNHVAMWFLERSGQTDLDALSIFLVPWQLVAVALTLSTLVAAVAGIYPAGRAAGLDPVVALRRE